MTDLDTKIQSKSQALVSSIKQKMMKNHITVIHLSKLLNIPPIFILNILDGKNYLTLVTIYNILYILDGKKRERI